MRPVTLTQSEFYYLRPHCEPQEERLLTSIVELVLKILCNFWRTSLSHFSQIPIEERSDLEGNVWPALCQLSWKRNVDPAPVQEYVTHCLKDKVDLVPNFIFKISTSDLPDKKKLDKPFIFIPVELEGRVRNHIVALVFDKVANRIEFYDPKGFTIKERSNWVHCDDHLKLIDVFQRVALEYGNRKTTLWENTRKHQYDSHNCGIYVLDYIERRTEEEKPESKPESSEGKQEEIDPEKVKGSPENIAINRLSYRKANNKRRKELISKLLGAAQKCSGRDSQVIALE